jgi:hypothetical protein
MRYQSWAEANGHRALSKTKLGTQLKDRGWRERRSTDREWIGVRLLRLEGAS